MIQLLKSKPNSTASAAFGLSALVLLVSACSSSSDSDPASPLRTGVFLDSAVEGLHYETATMSGTTNAAGEFNFNAGEMITFRLGGLALPEVQAANIVTPLTLFGAEDTNDTRVVNLSRLLQSLDNDGNVNNGISLPTAADTAIYDGSVDFSSPAFDTQAQTLLADIGTASILVDAATATSHLTQTLVDNDIISTGCTSDHPYVGRTAELSMLQHDVSGTITVLDDCTLEVSNFNYDGGGPSVFFYAAVDNNFRSPAAILGPRLNGQRWVNDTLLLSIPEGTSLEDFNSLSVWCSDFNANFGDAFIGDL